jgi:hypothetical protein
MLWLTITAKNGRHSHTGIQEEDTIARIRRVRDDEGPGAHSHVQPRVRLGERSIASHVRLNNGTTEQPSLGEYLSGDVREAPPSDVAYACVGCERRLTHQQHPGLTEAKQIRRAGCIGSAAGQQEACSGCGKLGPHVVDEPDREGECLGEDQVERAERPFEKIYGCHAARLSHAMREWQARYQRTERQRGCLNREVDRRRRTGSRSTATVIGGFGASVP